MLNGTPMSEDRAHNDWEETHERYAKVFNLDPSPGRAFGAQLRSSD